jgi:hypothetical protein
MAKKDVEKLLRFRKQLLYILILFVIGLFISIPMIAPFIRAWTSERVVVSFVDIIPFVGFNILLAVSYYEAVVLNASEKIKTQIYMSLLNCVLFISFIYFLRKFFINTYLILPLANILALLPGVFVLKHSADRIVNSYAKAKG